MSLKILILDDETIVGERLQASLEKRRTFAGGLYQSS